MCFQLKIEIINHWYYFTLYRYRGKYDHPTDQLPTTKNFELVVHICGNNGSLRVKIGQSTEVSSGFTTCVDKSEVCRFIVDRYLHMHLFFNNK